jgi:hypothetical protein
MPKHDTVRQLIFFKFWLKFWFNFKGPSVWRSTTCTKTNTVAKILGFPPNISMYGNNLTAYTNSNILIETEG